MMPNDLLTTLLEDRADEVALRSGSLAAVRRRARHRQTRQRVAVGAAGVVIVGGIAVGVVVSGNEPTRRVAPADTTAVGTGAASTTAMPLGVPPLAAPLQKGSTGAHVSTLQQQLTDLGFDPGPTDGVFGTSTQQAVWAFEGLVLGRPYPAQTGVVDDAVWQALHAAPSILPRRPEDDPTHIEIYLDLQVAAVFTNNSPTLVTHISSGNGETWCEVLTFDTDDKGQALDEPIQKDLCGMAYTPGGVFELYRRYDGNRATPLGGMYNPVYFNYGIAVYGAVNVPVGPVSHGGIRIPMFIAEFFPTLVSNGDNVYVWDGDTEPEDVGADREMPRFNYPNPDSTAG